MTTKTQLPYICAQVLNMLIQAVYDDDETPVTHAGALCALAVARWTTSPSLLLV